MLTSSTMDDDPIVIIATFDHDWQAHIARSLLAEHGIPSMLDNEIMSSIYPIGFNSIGGVNLRVRQSCAREAARIIAEADL